MYTITLKYGFIKNRIVIKMFRNSEKDAMNIELFYTVRWINI